MEKNLLIGLSTIGQQLATATLPADLFKAMAKAYVDTLPKGSVSEVLAGYANQITEAHSIEQAVALSQDFIIQRNLIDAVKYNNWMPFEQDEAK